MNTAAVYKSEEIKVKGNTWVITKVSGAYNYVNVRKVTNNPYGIAGTDFNTENEAIANYKSPAMKAALVQIFAELNK